MAAIGDSWSATSSPRRRTCVVIGGRGFVGRWLVLRLLELGKWIVRVADSDRSLRLDPSAERDEAAALLLSQAISAGLASYHHLDVRDRSSVLAVIKGSQAVFYTDVTDLLGQDFYNSYMIIVQGVKNVINACRECKVKRLIYNSSADVVFDGSRDINSGNESLAYPWKYADMLSDLRAQAEALVLFANDIDGLLTCALRPSGIFGPGDTQLVPAVVKLAQSGWMKFIIGGGENMCDFTYIENVAHAHICAEEALCSRIVSVAGKAFFITNNEPVKFWEFISVLLEGLGYQRPVIKLPVSMVYYFFLLLEGIFESLGIAKNSYMLSARLSVQVASRNRTFDCSAARKQVEYLPIVSLEDGIARTIASFSHYSRDSSYGGQGDFPDQSKADWMLGGGKVADILLWRDEKETFAYFLVSVVLFYWFFISGRSFISSTAYLLLMMMMALFGYGYLTSNLFDSNIKTTSFSCFDMQKSIVEESLGSIISLWNRGVHIIRSLAQGEDWNIFFETAVAMYFLKLIVSYYLTFAVGAALVCSFTCFFLYEQYELEIDALEKVLMSGMKTLKEWLVSFLPLSTTPHRRKQDW
ncbi:3beta-hydroxysteroid-dehydrogenase/decarboxylase isoform X1 [Syzygium oleosum]|uniref:3beta-hydroxysteroid-dehydrogenase/decarboxylase isoform X1 n=1 Tax=Syzygium oleosum TaxID=219896 RepID=UPI0011D2C011|nr:3beta-hydroxysteroid-dehydrogenase/decarboxylase isoform X1 [Syzygium oleosum]